MRNLLSHSRTERINVQNNNNLMQVAENPALIDRNSSQFSPDNVVDHRSSSQLVLPSVDADILTRLGILNQHDAARGNSSERQRGTPVRPTLSSRRTFFQTSVESNNTNINGTVNTLRQTVRQSRAHYICR